MRECGIGIDDIMCDYLTFEDLSPDVLENVVFLIDDIMCDDMTCEDQHLASVDRMDDIICDNLA